MTIGHRIVDQHDASKLYSRRQRGGGVDGYADRQERAAAGGDPQRLHLTRPGSADLVGTLGCNEFAGQRPALPIPFNGLT